jgi:hypothetical protein
VGWWQYGKDYDYDAPVKLLDKLLHSMSQSDDEQLVVVSQVLYLCVSLTGFYLFFDVLLQRLCIEGCGTGGRMFCVVDVIMFSALDCVLFRGWWSFESVG